VHNPPSAAPVCCVQRQEQSVEDRTGVLMAATAPATSGMRIADGAGGGRAPVVRTRTFKGSGSRSDA
jgi:hypothetical protein